MAIGAVGGVGSVRSFSPLSAVGGINPDGGKGGISYTISSAPKPTPSTSVSEYSPFSNTGEDLKGTGNLFSSLSTLTSSTDFKHGGLGLDAKVGDNGGLLYSLSPEDQWDKPTAFPTVDASFQGTAQDLSYGGWAGVNLEIPTIESPIGGMMGESMQTMQDHMEMLQGTSIFGEKIFNI
jgi:hypothetical protein